MTPSATAETTHTPRRGREEGPALTDGPARPPRGAPDAGRVYVDLAEGTVAARVRVAVEQWRADGGLDRGTVLVAVPTGSGWVDPGAVAASERVAGGDLTTVVVPYTQRPSWLETPSAARGPRT